MRDIIPSFSSKPYFSLHLQSLSLPLPATAPRPLRTCPTQSERLPSHAVISASRRTLRRSLSGSPFRATRVTYHLCCLFFSETVPYILSIRDSL
ncbi:hypothetical protein SDJN02_19552, partial [Cucurbita argyrosperma subsp. argyrosperma]